MAFSGQSVSNAQLASIQNINRFVEVQLSITNNVNAKYTLSHVSKKKLESGERDREDDYPEE